jgi:ABC-2 type transport system permease protein
MPIFEQGYQHWSGTLAGHAWRWLAITEQGVRMQMRRRGTKWAVVAGFAPALALAGALILWGLLEKQSSLLDPIKFLIMGLPEEIRAGPKAYRTSFWTMAFHYFFGVQTFFAMLLVLMVGPDLISQDLRFNAMPLYFSRPLRRIDYFAGKLGVIAAFLGAVAIVPALVAYGLGVAFSLEMSVFRDTGRLLLAVLGFGAVLVLSAGMLMLAISSLTRNSRFVSAAWLAIWVLSSLAAGSLEDLVRKDWCPLVSYTKNLDRIRETLLDTATAKAQFLSLVRAGRDAAMQAAPIGPFGPRRPRLFPPPKPDPPAMEIVEQTEIGEQPWTWSAGVLAGLFAASVLVLTTRVKTLDRLK